MFKSKDEIVDWLNTAYLSSRINRSASKPYKQLKTKHLRKKRKLRKRVLLTL